MFSHEEIQYLLHYIPESADYAVDATDLDSEDISEERVNGLKMLLNLGSIVESFTAAIILTSWGYGDGIEKLKYYIDNPEVTNRELDMPHRLYGYNDVFKHILMALTLYHGCMMDCGRGDESKLIVYPLIQRIIALAYVCPFNLDYFFVQIDSGVFDEFLPDLKEMLRYIINEPQINPWKIHDTIELLMRFDLVFIEQLLKEKGNVLEDFNF